MCLKSVIGEIWGSMLKFCQVTSDKKTRIKIREDLLRTAVEIRITSFAALLIERNRRLFGKELSKEDCLMVSTKKLILI